MRKPTNSHPNASRNETASETRESHFAPARKRAPFLCHTKAPGLTPDGPFGEKTGKSWVWFWVKKSPEFADREYLARHEISRVRAVRQVLRGSTAQISPSDNPREAPPVRYLRTLTPAPRTVSVGRALEFRRLAKRLSTPRASRSCLRAPPRGRATRRRGERVARAHGKTGSRARLR